MLVAPVARSLRAVKMPPSSRLSSARLPVLCLLTVRVPCAAAGLGRVTDSPSVACECHWFASNPWCGSSVFTVRKLRGVHIYARCKCAVMLHVEFKHFQVGIVVMLARRALPTLPDARSLERGCDTSRALRVQKARPRDFAL